MLRNFADYRKNRSFEAAIFGPRARELSERIAGVHPRHAVFCSFENRFARSGGLAAVVANTLPFLKETNRLESASLMTPFYPFLMDVKRLESTGLRFKASYAGALVDIEILQNTVLYSAPQPGSFAEYYLKADGFFNAQNKRGDPYIYIEDNPAENERCLRESALFFCVAAPYALAALDLAEDVVLHLQEWQTALLALTAKEAMLKGTLKSCAAIQTMHNPYDSYMPKSEMQRIVADASNRDRLDALLGDGKTAYEIGLPLVDAPIATVSENFALELASDVLQTDHFTPHLQNILRNSVVGINNGPFVEFSDKFPKRARHTVEEISAIKQDARQALLKILDQYTPPERFGALTYKSSSILNLPDGTPIVAMSGRLDPMQKGYDILLRALERFAPDEIKAILAPQAVRDSDLDYFREVAARRHGNVTVFPIRMEKGYKELQAGSAFGLMPSIYEPFGAAIEYMANGTVNIARRTGGLVDQIIDGDTGFLFREPENSYTLANIRDFADNSNNVRLRESNRWAADMVDALESVLRKAAAMYQQHRDDYYRMILRGFEKAEEFSWEKNALEYRQLYQYL